MEDTKKLIEKYKRELMELNRRSQKPATVRSRVEERVPVVDREADTAAPVSEPAEAAVETTEVSEPERKPTVIGYVNEESGEFPAVYDRFLAEIVDNDESLNPNDIVEHPKEEKCDEPVTVSGPEPPSENSAPTADNEVVGLSDVLFTLPKHSKVPSTQQVREDITEQSDPADNNPEENVSGVTDNSPTAPRPDLADVQSVSAEKAETLADQPISGTSKDEQLTGRSFEDESYPQNPDAPSGSVMRQGSGAEPINYPEPVYDDYDDFVRRNIGRGTILFRVYTAREALPIAGARCVVTKKIGGETRELHVLTTDSSGQTRTETLPAPSRELSQSFENNIQPFALYDATVTRKDFADVVLRDIPVFDGVQSIQRVAMVPVAEKNNAAEEITEVDNAL